VYYLSSPPVAGYPWQSTTDCPPAIAVHHNGDVKLSVNGHDA
jgi:hypothetical protein